MDWRAIGDTVEDVLYYRLATIGGTEVTLASVLAFVLALTAFFIVARLAARGVSGWAFRRVEVDPGSRYAFARVVQYVVFGAGLLISFQFLGLDLGSIAILLGALGIGIGLGLQSLTANFVSGIILLFERQVRVGDRITVADIEGDVVAINMRATTVRSVRNLALIVPNSEFTSSTVINWSHGDSSLLVPVDVGVSYDSDLDAVIRALRDVAEEHPEVLRQPEPAVRFIEFGDSAWNMRLAVWIPQAKEHIRVRSELNQAIVRKFRERGIEIPYPQRDLHLRSTVAAANGEKAGR